MNDPICNLQNYPKRAYRTTVVGSRVFWIKRQIQTLFALLHETSSLITTRVINVLQKVKCQQVPFVLICEYFQQMPFVEESHQN
jgi:hypothetical protein